MGKITHVSLQNCGHVRREPGVSPALGPPGYGFRIASAQHSGEKVRRIHLWFRLRDGRVGTSVLVNGPFSTPPTWPHSEGILVPHGQPLPPMACDIPVAK